MEADQREKLATNGNNPQVDENEELDPEKVAAAVDQRYQQARESMRSCVPASYLQAFASSGAKTNNTAVKLTSDGVPLVRPPRLGLGAEQAKPAKLSQMESKLQGQVMRDKAKAAGASGGESRAAKRKAEADKSDDDDEESRAGAIKSRIKTVSGTVQPLSKKQRKQLAKANAPSSFSPTASTSQLVGSASSKVPRGAENSHSPEHEHEHSVLGFPSEPSDQDYDVSEPDYGNKSFRIPFKPPITSDPPSPVDPTTDQSMASISAVPTPPTVTAPDDGQTSKQKKRKRNKQRRAEKRKQIRLSEGSHP